jgi:hypothetical protein
MVLLHNCCSDYGEFSLYDFGRSRNMVCEGQTLFPYVTGIQVANPVGHLNLSLVPLRGEGHKQLDYLLASEAIEAKLLEITEVHKGGNVPWLSVTSRSDKSILFLDGEELIGAKQNRILNTTILLPPKGKMNIPVSCVEQGRWEYKSNQFHTGDYAPAKLRGRKCVSVSHSLRATGVAHSDQGEVWDDVAEIMDNTEAESNTMAMSDAIKHYQKTIGHYIAALPYPEGARGVVTVINGKFAALDLFDRESTLEKIWSRLISGYAIDAISKEKKRQKVFSAKSAKTLLEHIGEIECQVYESADIGGDWRFEAEDVVGQALVVQEVCVHLSAFPNNT